jgi:hypothetical protein
MEVIYLLNGLEVQCIQPVLINCYDTRLFCIGKINGVFIKSYVLEIVGKVEVASYFLAPIWVNKWTQKALLDGGINV